MDGITVVLGFFVGALVGLTGIGGGSLMTPLLVLVVGVRPTLAIGTDLAYAALTKWVGGWQHARRQNVDGQLVLFLAIGSVPGALIGVRFLTVMAARLGPSVETLARQQLGVALMLVAVVMAWRALFSPAASAAAVGRVGRRLDGEWTTGRRVTAVVTGAVTGFLVGVTSVGAGSLIALVLIYLFPMQAVRVVGTDVLHGAVLTSAAALAHLGGGNIDLPLLLSLLAGSVPGVLVGSWAANKTPERWLRPALALCIFLAGLRLV